MQTLTGHAKSVTSVVFSPDGARLASGSEDYTVKLWSANTGAVVLALAGQNEFLSRVAFSPDGGQLASRDSENHVKVWGLQAGKLISGAPPPDWFTDKSTSRSPNGQWFACPGSDGTILLVKPLPHDDFELGYRASFARPDPDWHWQQALKYKMDKSWYAAAFHCEQVLKSRPDDAAAKETLERVRNQLNTAQKPMSPVDR